MYIYTPPDFILLFKTWLQIGDKFSLRMSRRVCLDLTPIE